MRISRVVESCLAIFALVGLPSSAVAPVLSPQIKGALTAITAAELKGDLSFLASDALQGRYTPSPGLDVAAEFIASKFRAAGLAPGGDQDYFQMAAMVDRRMPQTVSDLKIQSASETISVPAAAVLMSDTSQAASIERAPVLAIEAKDPEKLRELNLAGKAILVPQPDLDRFEGAAGMESYRRMHAFDRIVAESNAVLEISVSTHKHAAASPALLMPGQAERHRVPAAIVESEQLRQLLRSATAANGSNFTVTFDVPAPDDRKTPVKNVVAILRGSDPHLKDTCVLLTAHYDHIGTLETAGRMAMSRSGSDRDHIYNGANDDGSGTVSVIEIARAMATLNPHPKRSIVFMTFFGEERGELGSQYYAEHPVFPIGATIADVNLEQLGRTDSTVGQQVNTASLTGYDYSEVTRYFEHAGRETGIKVYKDDEASDAYFTRSDNAALAEQGVPAHTLTVAFDFPDYHALGDEWQKINYENMAKVDRMIMLALLDLANSGKAPAWNAGNPNTEPFREAQRKFRGR